MDSVLTGQVKSDGNTDFMNIPLGNEKSVKKKQPKRILHFSDGILEEYSTDEEEDKPPPPPPVNPKTLTWLPWFWYYIITVATKSLSAADFCGEKLAWFFGITSPKYQHAIDEYYRLKEEEEQEKAREERRKEQLEESKLSSIDIQTDSKDDNIDIEKF